MKLVPINEIPLGGETPLNDIDKLIKICQEMADLCIRENGIGLAAVQVGIPWNLFIYKIGDSFVCFINSDYEGIGDKIESIEGCLSIKTEDGKLRSFKVKRFPKVRLKGKILFFQFNKKIKNFDSIFEGIDAIVAQHESEHAKMILISDIGEEIKNVE